MKKSPVCILVLLILAISGNILQAEITRGERPFIDIYRVPDDAMIQGIIRVKLSESHSWLAESTSRIEPQFQLSGEAEWDALNNRFGVYKAELLFASAAFSPRYAERHRQWGFDRWLELHFKSKEDIRDIVMEYRRLSAIVEFAEPEYKKVLLDSSLTEASVLQAQQLRWTPNDTFLSLQWHYNNTGQSGGTPGKDISLFEAWNYEKGHQNVIVAEIDGGIQTNHPDLSGNIWSGVGWNFVTNSSVIEPHYHGTHVAGTVAAVNNNGIGVAGVAGGSYPTKGVSLMSCQVFNNTTSGGFHLAPVYAADNGAAISQNSWGYTEVNVYDQVTLDAIDYFNTHGGGSVLDGGITIFAAGNSGTTGNWYPGAYSGTMAVAATNNQDVLSYYSNWGTWVEISAPGGETDVEGSRGVASTYIDNRYVYMEGTSMACPHVSGAAALLVSYAYRNGVMLSGSLVRDILKDTADDHYPLNPAYIGMLGTGRLNAHAALQTLNQMINPTPLTAPFVEGFESSSPSWVSINGTQTNQWHRGSATSHTGTYGYYVSNDSGTTNAYTSNRSSIAHLYADVDFPAGTADYHLRFNWKGDGNSSDYLRVYLIDPSLIPTAGTALSTSYAISDPLYDATTWQNTSITLPTGLSGTTKRLVFSWICNNSVGANPPSALDNIRIVEAENEDLAIVIDNESEIVLPPVTDDQSNVITSSLIIDGVSGSQVEYQVGYKSVDSPYSNAGLDISLIADSFAGAYIVLDHNLGFIPPTLAYYLNGSWYIEYATGDWTDTTLDFSIASKSSKATDLIIVLSESGDSTLPVTLSSFNAMIGMQGVVKLLWTTASETGMLGFKLLRNQEDNLANAIVVSPLIEATNSSFEQHYEYSDVEALAATQYYYWLMSSDLDGSSSYWGPIVVETPDLTGSEVSLVPTQTLLTGNYPNPFNPHTRIRYELSEPAQVSICIYNSRGQLVRRLSQNHSKAGYYSLEFDGKDDLGRSLATGIYIYTFDSGTVHQSKRMMLLK